MEWSIRAIEGFTLAATLAADRGARAAAAGLAQSVCPAVLGPSAVLARLPRQDRRRRIEALARSYRPQPHWLARLPDGDGAGGRD